MKTRPMILSRYMEGYRKEISPRLRLIYWRANAELAWSLLGICRNRNRAEHIHGLEEKIKTQAEEITRMRLSAEDRNIERKALNILVACDGNCNGAYMADPASVTEEVVWLAERNAERLRHWWKRGGQAAANNYRAECAERNRTKGTA